MSIPPPFYSLIDKLKAFFGWIACRGGRQGGIEKGATKQLLTLFVDVRSFGGGEKMRTFVNRWWRGEESIFGVSMAMGQCTVTSVCSRSAHLTTSWSRTISFPASIDQSGMRGAPGSLGVALREVVALSGLRHRGCALAVPSEMTFTAIVAMPPEVTSAPRSEVELVALELAKLDPALVVGRVLPIWGKMGGRTIYTLIAVRRNVLRWYKREIGDAGLELRMVIPRAVVLYRGLLLGGVCDGKGIEIVIDETEEPSVRHTYLHGVLIHSGSSCVNAIECVPYEALRQLDRETIDLDEADSCKVVVIQDYSKTQTDGDQSAASFTRMGKVIVVVPSIAWGLSSSEVVCVALGNLWERHS